MNEQTTNDGRGAVVALFGASNLAMCLLQVAAQLAARFPPEGGATGGAPRLRVYAARGCGRSYGLTCGVAGFSTPGLSTCGMLEALERELDATRAPRIFALLTDVGNDILYGAGVDAIVAWVDDIARRVRDLGGRVAVTSLPVESVRAIPEWKFRLLRPLFYPGRPVRRENVLEQVRQVEAELRAAGNSGRFQLLPTRREWYGFDHFHLRRAARSAAFATWLEQLCEAAAPSRGPGPGARLAASRWRLRYGRPARYFLWGRERRRPQGGMRLAAGVKLYFY